MKHPLRKTINATLLVAGLLVPPVLDAQNVTMTGPGAEASPLVRRHHEMAAIMQDMIGEMSAMQDQMARGEVAPGTRKEMSQKMRRMSGMMRRMSGLIDRPAMSDSEARRQLERMRKEMDDMSKSSSMKEPHK